MSETAGESPCKRQKTRDRGEQVPLNNDDFLPLFECPVCYDYALPPIFQCNAGHILCSKCLPELQHCPSCRVPLQDTIRSLTMEKVAALVLFPCRNASAGCSERLLYPAKKEHEVNCKYRPCPCPLPKLCPWSGSWDQVMEHVLTCCDTSQIFEHTGIITPNLTRYNTNKNAVKVLTCFDQHFMFLVRCEDRNGEITYYTYVQLLGDPHKTESYSYRVELFKGRDHFMLETTPRTIYESYAGIRESKCLSVGAALAKQFAQNDVFTITATISQKSELK